MGSDIADFNKDSRLDIIVADMLSESNHRQKMLKGTNISITLENKENHV